MEDNFIIYPETMQYLNDLHSFEDDALLHFETSALENNCPIIQRDLAHFLQLLIRMKQPKSVLELGTNVGFSSSLMALAGGKHIHIDTVEFKEENVHIARQNHSKFNISEQIDVHFSEALAFLSALTDAKTYDFVFIDANKKDNQEYVELILPHLNTGAVICIDNLLWKGRTTAKSLVTEGSLESTLEIRKFNRWIVEHPALFTQLLPIGDGISLSTKK